MKRPNATVQSEHHKLIEKMSSVPNTTFSLPVEIRLFILAFMPDVRSLLSAAHSCHDLYFVFKENEKRLVRNALQNCIGPSNLPEALLTFRYSLELRRDRHFHFLSDFIQLLAKRECRTNSLVTTQAVQICDYHTNVVSILARRYFQSCTEAPDWAHPLKISLGIAPVTETEFGRVVRALYRFELYRRLFRGPSFAYQPLEIYYEYFSNFSPWENAQVGCIYDFLARELLPAYNHVAKHNIEWGIKRARFDADIDDRDIEYLLTRGLQQILEISSQQTYEERDRELTMDNIPRACNFTFWAGVMRGLDEDVGNGHEYYKKLSNPRALCADDDSGAETMWRLAHSTNSLPRQGFYGDKDRALRQWGYVLWDEDRLPSLLDLHPPQNLTVFTETSSSGRPPKDMVKSWEARESIYLKGGMGFWAENDQSRIVWTDPVENRNWNPFSFLRRAFISRAS